MPRQIFLVQKMKAITPTEKRVLELIANGYSTHDVASALAISKYTVLSHRRSLLGKFGVKNSVQMVTKAIETNSYNLMPPKIQINIMKTSMDPFHLLRRGKATSSGFIDMARALLTITVSGSNSLSSLFLFLVRN